LQVELKEYRKRLSWVSTNGLNRSQPIVPNQAARNSASNNHNDFQFEFPKFGDLPPMPATNLFGNSNSQKQPVKNGSVASSHSTPGSTPAAQSASGRRSTTASQSQTAKHGSLSQSPLSNGYSASPRPQTAEKPHGSVDSLSGLFSPSILDATRHASLGGYFPANTYNAPSHNARGSLDNGVGNNLAGPYSNSSTSNSDSPGSSAESQNNISSIGTSPEPSLNSPANKLTEPSLNAISEENQFSFGGFTATPGSDLNGINWLAQQNNNTFDPVLFGDYRETQDNVLSQDFGSFFNDAYPLPDLGSPLHNYTDLTTDQPPKHDLLSKVDEAKNEDVGPDQERPMTCNKIWDRLQSMEKFRNGEIDIDNLCSELRAKAKCSEGGAVVDRKDVEKILGGAA